MVSLMRRLVAVSMVEQSMRSFWAMDVEARMPIEGERYAERTCVPSGSMVIIIFCVRQAGLVCLGGDAVEGSLLWSYAFFGDFLCASGLQDAVRMLRAYVVYGFLDDVIDVNLGFCRELVGDIVYHWRAHRTEPNEAEDFLF